MLSKHLKNVLSCFPLVKDNTSSFCRKTFVACVKSIFHHDGTFFWGGGVKLLLTVSGGDGDRHVDIISIFRPLAAAGCAGCGVPLSIRHNVAVDQVCCGTTIRTLT